VLDYRGDIEMLSKQNVQALCLGLVIAAITLVCQVVWFRTVVATNPLILLLGPQLDRASIFFCAAPVIVGSYFLSLYAFRKASAQSKTQITLATLVVLVAFPPLFLNIASTWGNVLWTTALIGCTLLAIMAAAAYAKKHPLRSTGPSAKRA
jgi:ABC-type Na+ efflux pump permease subunit